MVRSLALAATLSLAATLALAQPKPPRPGMEDIGRTPAAPSDIAPESLFPAIRAAFARLGCSVAMDGGEQAFAEALALSLRVPAEVLTDRQSRWYRPIDAAIDQLEAQETLVIDRAAGRVRYPGCSG